MRRSPRKRPCESAKVECVAPLEGSFAHPVLFSMMHCTQAHRPPVRRLQPDPAVGSAANVSTFDGDVETSRYATVMTPDPCPVGWTLTLNGKLAFFVQAIGQAHGLRLDQHKVRRVIVAGGGLVAANIGPSWLLWRMYRNEQRLPLPRKTLAKLSIEFRPLVTDRS